MKKSPLYIMLVLVSGCITTNTQDTVHVYASEVPLTITLAPFNKPQPMAECEIEEHELEMEMEPEQ